MIKEYRTTLINQHEIIEDYIQKLDEVLREHIQYEESILDEREMNRPSHHIDVKEKLDKHKEDHEKLQKLLNEFKKKIKKHILLFDKVHIHKL
jgi:cell fate (sporulation/competence/biofilm development) regulator YlbF (YheA/YmcA/DUF963 family)